MSSIALAQRIETVLGPTLLVTDSEALRVVSETVGEFGQLLLGIEARCAGNAALWQEAGYRELMQVVASDVQKVVARDSRAGVASRGHADRLIALAGVCVDPSPTLFAQGESRAKRRVRRKLYDQLPEVAMFGSRGVRWGLRITLVASFALAGCREDDQSPTVPQARDVAQPGQEAPTLGDDAGAKGYPGAPAVGTETSVGGSNDETPTAPQSTSDAGTETSVGGSNDETPSAPMAGPTIPTIPTIASGDSVFFVGNSFFSSWDRVLPDWVSAIGRAVTPPITIHTGSFIVPGNLKLSWFLEQSDSQEALRSKRYNVFVIQPEEREAVDDTANFKQAVRDWNAAIVASGARTMLFMTWDLPNEKGSPFFEKLSTAFDEIGDELGIPVIPVGLIYDDCNKAPFPGKEAGSYWLTDGDLHQVESGSAVNAYATFGMLTGVNAMGCPIDAPANSNTPEMLKYLSDMSWTRVAPRLIGSK